MLNFLTYYLNTKIKHTNTKIKKKLCRNSAVENQLEPQKFNQFNVKDHLKELPVSSIRSWQRLNSIPYSVAMYNTVRDFNLGSVIRNASAFSIKEINIIGFRKFDKRGAVGSYNYVKINYFVDFNAFLHYVGVQNLVALELPEHYPDIHPDNFIELQDFKWKPNQCLLIGEEGSGIPFEDISRCWSKVKITIPGSMRSLNAATASGIAMYDISISYAKSIK